jgi:hypothetical protein
MGQFLKHKAFIGQSGCGKTTLVTKMVKSEARKYSLIVFLNTQEEDFVDKLSPFHARSIEELEDHIDQSRRIVIYHLSDEADVDEWEQFDELAVYLWGIKRHKENANKNFLFIVDECDNFQTVNKILPIYRKLLGKGRKWNLEMWNITQRPALINKIIFTQSKELYMFELSAYDYDVMSKWFDYENPELYEYVIVKN